MNPEADSILDLAIVCVLVVLFVANAVLGFAAACIAFIVRGALKYQ